MPALVLSAWRASGCLPGLVTAEAGGSSDRWVGSGSDAQLGGAFVHGGIQVGLMLCQALADVPDQQIGAPGSDMGEFSERDGLALLGGRAADGVPAA